MSACLRLSSLLQTKLPAARQLVNSAALFGAPSSWRNASAGAGAAAWLSSTPGLGIRRVGLQLPQQLSTMLNRRSCIAMFRRALYLGSQTSPPLAPRHYGHPSTGVYCLVHSVSASVHTSRLSSPIRSLPTSGFNSFSCKSSSCSSKGEMDIISIKQTGFPPQQPSPLRLSSPPVPQSLNSKASSLTSPRYLSLLSSLSSIHNRKYHSDPEHTSTAMIPTVNRTSLHPSGVLPAHKHTEIEEELHDKANIDYDRVAIVPNPSVAALYEDALVYETGTAITSSGALTAYSGVKTGRSPNDKRIVKEPSSENEIWWGPVNKPMSPEVWRINRERAVDYLNTRSRIYVVDGFAGWDERYRINVRVVCARAYHALFMRNMLIRPRPEELEHFEPDYVIYNAGSFPANRYTEGMTSSTSVAINFAEKEMVILGTEYAGEMKKGVFTVLFYEMPVKHNVLTLHSSANEGKNGDVTVFFGLSGTGKTTLSADQNRALIGDDEHCWTDTGVFNIEGGCYAKCVNLSAEKEPDIFNAIRFGSVLENVVFDPETRVVDYDDTTLTENTRAAYPIEYISNAKIPCISSRHPSNIILLCCDARGVLPVISKLTPEQVMYHFISGYTSKMAGTEEGVTEPIATFSACFAQPFLALSPMRYAKMLAEKITEHKANAWLLNTGWVGGSVVKGGRRCPLKYTRAILDSIHSGELANAEYETYEVFNLHIPTHIDGVPSEILNPRTSWKASDDEFTMEVTGLAQLFTKNFDKYSDEATPDVQAAGPVL